MSAAYKLTRGNFAPRHVALVVYALAMGWLEAVVVVYIRTVIGLAHSATLPGGAQILTLLRAHAWMLPTEQSRELATLFMLAGVAMMFGENARTRWGAFLITFGLWDLAYYGALRMLIGWPDSFGSVDCLFLIPPTRLWNQPVWVPMAISIGMIWGGLRLWRPPRRYGR